MVHPVVARGVEHVFEGPQRFDDFGVDPELVEDVQVLVGDEMGRGNGEGEGKVEDLGMKN